MAARRRWNTEDTPDPEDEEGGEDVDTEDETPNDLPWKDEDKSPSTQSKANYALKTPAAKTSKADKFDALFEDDED